MILDRFYWQSIFPRPWRVLMYVIICIIHDTKYLLKKRCGFRCGLQIWQDLNFVLRIHRCHHCVCVCAGVCAYVWVCVSECMCTCVCVCVCVCVCAFLCVCVGLCEYMCVCVCICVWVSVCVCFLCVYEFLCPVCVGVCLRSEKVCIHTS